MSLGTNQDESPSLPRSPRLPLSPYTPSTPDYTDIDPEDDGTAYWTPLNSEIVEIDSSSDEEPPKKKLITDYLATKQSRIHSNQQGIPNFSTQLNPVNWHTNHMEGDDIIMSKQPEPAQPQLQTENAPVKRPVVYQTYTLAKKIEVVAYVKATSESLAAEHFRLGA